MAYLDHNATTKILDEAIEEQSRCLRDLAGNPSARQHVQGSRASEVLESSRSKLALRLNVPSTSVILTSGATEAISLAILGFLGGRPKSSRRVVVWEAEHKAVLQALAFGERQLGATISFVGTSPDGQPNYMELEQHLALGQDLVCVAAANNETGIMPNLGFITKLVKAYESRLLCDSTQIIGKSKWTELPNQADFLTLSGHKFGGPRGIGVLIVDRELQLELDSPIVGGGQERGIRGGTSNAPAASALAVALDYVLDHEEERMERVRVLSEHVAAALSATSHFLRLNTSSPERLNNTFNIQMEGLNAEELMALLPQHSFATGSACSHGSDDPSHVLLSLGLSPAMAGRSIRLSLGPDNTAEEIFEFFEDINRIRIGLNR